MKFFHKLTIILALAGIGGLTACSDDDSGFLKRNLREMSFSYVESSNTFTIRATGDWYISDVPDSREWTGAYGWVHVDQLAGKGSPDTYQKISPPQASACRISARNGDAGRRKRKAKTGERQVAVHKTGFTKQII